MRQQQQLLLFSLVSLILISLPSIYTQCSRGRFTSFRDPRGRTHNYLFSWENPSTSGVEVGAFEAQNICRRYCMNLVSIETPQENNFIKQRIAFARVRYIWTSGRKNGNIVNGWFWSGSGARLGPTNNRANGDWSHTGGGRAAQPDNRENTPGDFGFTGRDESCLSILNNFYNDGIRWHDVACHHVKPFVCESG